jgi:hypothetical protein
MAYKRYFYRNGKKLGPYFYESYRDKNGRVKKRYLGTEDTDKKNKFTLQNLLSFKQFFLVALILIGIISAFFFINTITPTGNTIFNLKDKYNYGENIEGTVNLQLKDNLDKDTKIVFSLNNQTKEFSIYDLIDASKIYPEINFDLELYLEESQNNNPENISEQNLSIIL